MSGDLELSVPCFAELKEASVGLSQDINDVLRAKKGRFPNFVFVCLAPPTR